MCAYGVMRGAHLRGAGDVCGEFSIFRVAFDCPIGIFKGICTFLVRKSFQGAFQFKKIDRNSTLRTIEICKFVNFSRSLFLINLEVKYM